MKTNNTMAKKKNYTSLSDPKFLDDFSRKAERAEKIQEIWDVTTNIIGYSLIVISIIAGVYFDYLGSTPFTVFCIAAAIYFFSKYYYFPYVANDRVNQIKHKWTHYCASMNFTSFLGNGEVLYGNFGDILNRRGNTSYCFLSICYIPLIPIGCYRFYQNRKMIQITSDKISDDNNARDVYWGDRLSWNWREILYIYMKNWSFAVMVFIVIDIIMRDFVNPAIYG